MRSASLADGLGPSHAETEARCQPSFNCDNAISEAELPICGDRVRPQWWLSITLLTAFLGVSVCCANSNERTIRLKTAVTYTVPEGKAWNSENLKPWTAPEEVGTADFAIKGSAAFGKDQIFIDGTFEVVVKRRNSPFTVKSGSTVEVLDSRGERRCWKWMTNL